MGSALESLTRDRALEQIAAQLTDAFSAIYPERTIDWPFVLTHIKTGAKHWRTEKINSSTIRRRGQDALAHSVSARMAAFAKEAQLDLSDPPVVYAFGWHFTETLASCTESLAGNPQATKLYGQTKLLQDGLTRYAGEHLLPYGEEGLKFLQKFPLMAPYEFANQKRRHSPLFSPQTRKETL